MTVDLYRRFNEPLSDEMLFACHRMVLQGRNDVYEVGRYRADKEPVQVVSGALYDPRVNFEAPPYSAVPREMKDFVDWFNWTAER